MLSSTAGVQLLFVIVTYYYIQLCHPTLMLTAIYQLIPVILIFFKDTFNFLTR